MGVVVGEYAEMYSTEYKNARFPYGTKLEISGILSTLTIKLVFKK